MPGRSVGDAEVLPDAAQAGRQRRSVQTIERQDRECTNAILQLPEGGGEGTRLCQAVALDRRRVFDAPVSRDGLIWPNGTGLAGGAVAYGEHEIQDRCPGLFEFVPTLGTQSLGRATKAFEGFDGERVDLPFGLAAGRERAKAVRGRRHGGALGETPGPRRSGRPARPNPGPIPPGSVTPGRSTCKDGSPTVVGRQADEQARGRGKQERFRDFVSDVEPEGGLAGCRCRPQTHGTWRPEILPCSTAL